MTSIRLAQPVPPAAEPILVGYPLHSGTGRTLSLLTSGADGIRENELSIRQRLVELPCLAGSLGPARENVQAEEYDFLSDYFDLDSVGWAMPFLLVREVISIDTKTVDCLAKGQEEDSQ